MTQGKPEILWAKPGARVKLVVKRVDREFELIRIRKGEVKGELIFNCTEPASYDDLVRNEVYSFRLDNNDGDEGYVEFCIENASPSFSRNIQVQGPRVLEFGPIIIKSRPKGRARRTQPNPRITISAVPLNTPVTVCVT